jgi:hypothetical protein
MSEDEVVRLTHASNPAQAYLWKQVLEAEGIACKVVGEYLEGGMGNVSFALPEVWVQRHDLERAQALLAAHQGRTDSPDTEDEA